MIGKRKSSKTTIQVNTSAIIPIEFAAGAQYGSKCICVTPLWGRMIPNGDIGLLVDRIGVPNAYMDFGFRRVTTMFTQLRVKGCYIKVTPIMTASEMDFVTIWSTWERKAKHGDWNMYGGTSMLETEAARKIKETAQLQGKKGMTLNVNKGAATYQTQCVAYGPTERAGWIDSDTVMSVDDSAAKSFYLFYNNRCFNPAAAASYIPFNPMCFISFEAPITPTLGVNVAFMVEMTCYFTFRYPGSNLSDTTLVALLKLNKDLIPWTPTKKPQPREKQEEDDDDALVHDEQTIL